MAGDLIRRPEPAPARRRTSGPGKTKRRDGPSAGRLDDDLLALGAALRARQAMLATAESCTGGLIAAACTDVAGASEWFERGFVTYSNAAKSEMLGVAHELIAAHGAVSAEVASAMAEGALVHSRAAIAASVTGIAGPGGGSAAKPVGTVWIGFAERDRTAAVEVHWFSGDRAAIRAATVRKVIEMLLARLAEG